MTDWHRLCGLAVTLCGSQQCFRREARILQRLVARYGVSETEAMLRGAIGLRWSSLRSLGSEDGLGRRMAKAAFWDKEKRAPSRLAAVGTILQQRGLVR